MTKERIRIVMAECCGWIQQTFKGYSAEEQDTFEDIRWYKDGKYIAENPPNYPDDLNAVHEAEKTLDINSLSRYADELEKVCVPVHICPLTHWQSVIMATALQRCEAFIKTVCPEKWEEER